MAGTRGKRTEAERAKAAMLWGQGLPMAEILKEMDLDRRALWEWRQDPEFQAIAAEVIDQGIKDAAQRLRALAPLTIEAFERGLRSTHQQKAIKVGEGITKVNLEDNSLAVRAADIVTQRIPELMPQRHVDVDVEVSVQVAKLIQELDAEPDSTPADRPPPPPPPPG